ncbi:caveolin-2-like [Clarias gariepinus]|uniref:caveolin-2-like n=1 Tax=Clarias gariepinus TaxID=13013 RepID=UPI00234E1D64|nr:caveolin-2-like [Clarias gariepinus]
MDGDSTLKDSRIDMRDIVEQEGISFLEQNGGSSKDIPEISVEEQRGNQDEEDSTHMKVFITDRDRRGINEYLKVTFEDVIAEPASVHSFNKVWLWSHVLFEVSRLWIYRVISLLLAVPIALLVGLLFSVFSFLHIWLIVPAVQLLLNNMYWVKVVWASVLDLTISPFFFSLGRCCRSISIYWTKD